MSAACEAVKEAARALIAAQDKAYTLRDQRSAWVDALDEVDEAVFRVIRAAKALVVDEKQEGA